MKKTMVRLVAAVLACLMLTGCGVDYGAYLDRFRSAASAGSVVAFGDMTYSRPDMTAVRQTLDDACTAAAGENLNQVVERIYDFYDAYDSFYTNYSLADIYYCMDLTDIYWEEEYNYCLEQCASVDAMLEELYYALADSPMREELEGEEYFGEGYFDSYDGENMWGREFTDLLDQEGQLQSRYYELTGLGAEYEIGSEDYYSACGGEMARVMVELIGLRQKIAEYWGYDDYVQFATDFYYYRDYTAGQTEKYLERIREELVPLYIRLNQDAAWYERAERCPEERTFAYVREVARNMGGTVEEAFRVMEQGGLYDITYGENKYNASFEVYLTSYREPFVFMNPEMSTYDCLTFAHEFGHFCNDYASGGSYAGVDVLEFFSQGMEYLSLCYGDGTETLTELKMADSLCLYVEQAAFASFEMQMYQLTGEELTVENLYALYEKTAQAYGFDSVGFDPREFVSITHLYTNPMYIMSYVVSNDAAMQLYQMETETAGTGLVCFEDNLTTQEAYFLSFLDCAGLESPFEEGRIQSVRETFETILE